MLYGGLTSLMINSKSIAVSGASGFIGRHLLASIAGQNDATVVAIARSEATKHLSTDVEWRKVKNYEGPEFTAALTGCDTLIHLADGGNRDMIEESNNAALVAAIASSSISHVILASSIYASMGENVSGNQYGRRKLQLEDAVRTISGISVTVFRLPPVYGDGCKGGFATLAALVKKGLPLPIKRAVALRDYIAVQNVTDLFSAYLKTDIVNSFAVIEPSDGQPISTADLALAIASVIDQPARLFAVPNGLLRSLGRVTGKRTEIEALLSPLRVSHSVEDIAAMTGGWRPSIQMPEALRFLKA